MLNRLVDNFVAIDNLYARRRKFGCQIRVEMFELPEDIRSYRYPCRFGCLKKRCFAIVSRIAEVKAGFKIENVFYPRIVSHDLVLQLTLADLGKLRQGFRGEVSKPVSVEDGNGMLLYCLSEDAG